MKKRICAAIMSIVIVLNLVGVQKAKAVVAEAGFIGSLVGIVMSSMGYTWTANNMNEQGFGDALADAVQDYLNIEVGGMSIEEWALFETCVQLSGNNSFIIQQALVKKISEFSDWLSFQFGVTDSQPSDIVPFSTGVRLQDGSFFNFLVDGVHRGTLVPIDEFLTLPNNIRIGFVSSSSSSYRSLQIYSGDSLSYNQQIGKYGTHYALSYDPSNEMIGIAWGDSSDGVWFSSSYSSKAHLFLASDYNISVANRGSLSVVKSPAAQNPDIADDGTQAYELTIANLTAKDLEELISAAVAQAIAGTLAVEGTVTEAVEPVAPPLAGDYAVPGLETIFPFCIPFDIYAFCSALNAEPVAPCFEWQMQYAPLGLDYTFEIDLSDFDDVARILRTMELLAFCVGLAFWTRHLIRG